MASERSTNINYMHTDATECEAFCAKVRSLCRSKSPDTLKL